MSSIFFFFVLVGKMSYLLGGWLGCVPSIFSRVKVGKIPTVDFLVMGTKRRKIYCPIRYKTRENHYQTLQPMAAVGL